ncbi:hypothetical protein JXJ21_25600 [candidate division KSB1 bacterium]|nr:hypothetical protein [candidate division KSB1 bacterium]
MFNQAIRDIQRLCVRLTALIALMSPLASGQSEAVKPQLWNPGQAVDILVYNPDKEPLKLPEPFTPSTLSELYGPDVNENNLHTIKQDAGTLAPVFLSVGANITFAITYADDSNEGFNDPSLGQARRNAFQYGASIWAALIQGPATVSVQATMTPRGGSATAAVLASSSPGQYHSDFTRAPYANTFYAETLVEIITGSDPDANTFEINVDYNSDVDDPTVLGNMNWYYGTDADPGNDVDFVTVTAHELAHGLGFIASFRSDGSYGIGSNSYPVIYDRFLVNGAGTALISLPTSAINVTGNNVFWNGLRGSYAYRNDFGGTGRLPMYAPTTWEGGSSIHHIDEATFTGIWELQTPYNDDAVHKPDLILLGILQDIAHSLANSRYVDKNASGFEDGSSGHPFNTLNEGITNVPTGGSVRILPGSYNVQGIFTKKMKWHSSGGVAIIGTSSSLMEQNK